MGFLFFDIRTADLSKLIAAAQHSDLDDTPAMNEIIGRFEPMTRRLAHTMATCPYLRDDIANAARIGLVHAVRRHDHRAAGFSTYAEHFMRGAAQRERQRLTVPAQTDIEAVAVLADPKDGFATALDTLNPWGDGEIASIIAALSPEQQEITSRRYAQDEPLEALAATSGTTVSAVSQRLATIHRRVVAMRQRGRCGDHRSPTAYS